MKLSQLGTSHSMAVKCSRSYDSPSKASPLSSSSSTRPRAVRQSFYLSRWSVRVGNDFSWTRSIHYNYYWKVRVTERRRQKFCRKISRVNSSAEQWANSVRQVQCCTEPQCDSVVTTWGVKIPSPQGNKTFKRTPLKNWSRKKYSHLD
jgi:hypothetical protein